MAEKYVLTVSKQKVFKDYRDNLGCQDIHSPALALKAEMLREQFNRGAAKGLSRFGSVGSEDALSWSCFRELEQQNLVQVVYDSLGITDDPRHVLYWGRDAQSRLTYQALQSALDQVEPPKVWRQQTEPDIILLGAKTTVFIEVKLGKPNEPKNRWDAELKENHKLHYKSYISRHIRPEFQDVIESFMPEYLQLFRNLFIGQELADRNQTSFYLCALVSRLNAAGDRKSYEEKIADFKRYLVNPEIVRLLHWQDLYLALKSESQSNPGLSALCAYLQAHPYLGLN